MISGHTPKVLICKYKDKISSQRVLDVEGPKIEVTVSANGNIGKFVRGGRDRAKTS